MEILSDIKIVVLFKDADKSEARIIFKTRSNVIRKETFRFLCSMATHYRAKIYQADVKNAYPLSELHELIFVDQPEGVDSVIRSCTHYNGDVENFESWSSKFQSYLILSNLSALLKEVENVEIEEWNEELASDRVRNELLYGLLAVLCEKTALKMIDNGKSTYRNIREHGMRAYKNLRDHAFGQRSLRGVNLLRKIDSRRLKGSEKMDEYIAEMTNMFTTMEEIEQPVSNTEQVMKILNGLPKTDEYLKLSAQLLLKHPDNPAAVAMKLKTYEATVATLRQRRPRDDRRTIVSYATREVECWKCGKKGHIKRFCPEAQRQNARAHTTAVHAEQIIGGERPTGTFPNYPQQEHRGRGRGRGRGRSRGERSAHRANVIISGPRPMEKSCRGKCRETTPYAESRESSRNPGEYSTRKRKASDALHTAKKYVAHFTARIESWEGDYDLILDSGATTHMTCREDWLHDVTNCEVEIRAAEDTVFTATKKGTLKFKVQDKNGILTPISLPDTLYAPNLNCNLMSASPLIDHGCEIML